MPAEGTTVQPLPRGAVVSRPQCCCWENSRGKLAESLGAGFHSRTGHDRPARQSRPHGQVGSWSSVPIAAPHDSPSRDAAESMNRKTPASSSFASGAALRRLGRTMDACTKPLASHLPEAAAGYVASLLARRPIAVRVSRPRRTKLGDHRPPRRGDAGHRITVNADLNPFAFLTTLLHEIAHADVWEQARRRWPRPRPHGPEWKQAFARLLEPVVAEAWLPDDVAEALASYMANPAAMSCSDRRLVLTLARYDANAVARTRVEDLATGQRFRVESGQVFCLGRRVRTRFLCVDTATGVEYRVHGLAFAEPVAAAHLVDHVIPCPVRPRAKG